MTQEKEEILQTPRKIQVLFGIDSTSSESIPEYSVLIVPSTNN